MSEVPHRRLGRYDLLGLLATGGMAEIFLARQEGPAGFERAVVLKRVLPHLARQREFHDMFLDEARIVSRIHHPNVVSVHELGDHKNELFLVMEYLEGENLATVLKYLRRAQGMLPIRLAAHIVSEACAGLHAAHELADESGRPLHIVHRDVSPQNLFVLYGGAVKVIDFGIAKALDRKAGRTQTGQVKGKFAYMAPEQIGAQAVDRRADVFALGTILHELLTGKKLFARDHDLLVLKAICEEPIEPPSAQRPDVPKALDDVVMRALSRKTADRYPTAAAMRRDLTIAMRAIADDDLPDEALAALMSSLFAERIARQQDLLSRMRAGQTITHVPTAEPTGSEVTPPAPAEPTSLTNAVSPGVVSVEAPPIKKARWPVAAVTIAASALAVVGIWYFTHAGASQSATSSLPGGLATSEAVATAKTTSEPKAEPSHAASPAQTEAPAASSSAASAPAASATSQPRAGAGKPFSVQPARPVTAPPPAPPPPPPPGGGFTRFD